MLDRLTSLSAAFLASAVAVLAPVQHQVSDLRPTILATTVRAFDATPLYPGGPPAQSDVAVRYHGPGPARVQLQVLDAVAAASPEPACRAQRPLDDFALRVSSSGQLLYLGGLATLAPPGVAIPGQSPGRRWSSGEEHVVHLSVWLLASAGNADMGCAVSARFRWSAQ